MKVFLTLAILALAGFCGYLFFKPAAPPPAPPPRIFEVPVPMAEKKAAGPTKAERLATERARLEVELNARLESFEQLHQQEIDKKTREFAAVLNEHLEKDAQVIAKRREVPNRSELRQFERKSDVEIDAKVKQFAKGALKDHRGRYNNYYYKKDQRDAARAYREYLRQQGQTAYESYRKQLDKAAEELAKRFKEEYGKADQASLSAYRAVLEETLNKQVLFCRSEMEKTLTTALADYEKKLADEEAPAPAAFLVDLTAFAPEFPLFTHTPRDMIRLNYE